MGMKAKGNRSSPKKRSLTQALFAPKLRDPSRPRIVSKGKGALRLSECSIKYALAHVDPFNPAVKGVCNPAISIAETQKLSTSGGFDIYIGTNGFGFIILTSGVSNNGIAAFYTTAAFTGTASQVLTANNTLNTGVSTYAFSNLPYSNTDIITSGTGRPLVSILPVCVGLEITYTGTTSDQGGMIYYYEDPLAQNVSGATVSDLLDRPETIRMGVNRDRPCVFTHTPKDTAPTDFQALGDGDVIRCYPWCNGTTGYNTTIGGGTSYTYSSSSVIVGAPSSIVFIQGKAGNSFHVDIISHLEATGIKASQMATQHHVDINGAEAVTAASTMIPEWRRSQPNTPLWGLMRGAISTVSQGMAAIAVPMTIRAVSSLLV